MKIVGCYLDENGLLSYSYNLGLILAYVQLVNQDTCFFTTNLNYSFYDIVDKICNLTPTIIIFTLTKFNINITLTLADNIRKKNKKTIILLGGFIAAGNARIIIEKYNFISGCLLSEGELILWKIVENINQNHPWYDNVKGLVYRNDSNICCENGEFYDPIELNQIPSPYNKVINPKTMFKHIGAINLSSSRGCNYSCAYCYHPLIRKKIRKSSISQLIEGLYCISKYFSAGDSILIDFYDDNFIIDYNNSMEFLKAMILNKWKFQCNFRLKIDTRIDSIDRQFIELFSKAGGYYIGFGLESVNVRTLTEMDKLGKKNPSDDDVSLYLNKFENIASFCRESRIRFGIYIIQGWKTEKLKNTRKTIKFAKSLQPNEIHQKELIYYKKTGIWPDNHENYFYLDYENCPGLYKYNPKKIKFLDENPFFFHFNHLAHKKILTGITHYQYSSNLLIKKILIKANNIPYSFFLNNCILSAQITFMQENKRKVKLRFIKIPELNRNNNSLEIRISETDYSNKFYHTFNLWKNRYLFFLHKDNYINLLNLNTRQFLNNNRILSLKKFTKIFIGNICMFTNHCPADRNYCLYVDSKNQIKTCIYGVVIGNIYQTSENLHNNFKIIKQVFENKYGCSGCDKNKQCVKCVAALQKYKYNYCAAVKRINRKLLKNYITYMNKFYFYNDLNDFSERHEFKENNYSKAFK